MIKLIILLLIIATFIHIFSVLHYFMITYFSIVTAATPGYAGYTPASGLYTLIAGAQAIFGTFMWAAFIATFTRKWQR